MIFGSMFVGIFYTLGFILCLVGFFRKNSKIDKIALSCILLGYIGHTIILVFNISTSIFLSKGQFYFSLFVWFLILIFFILILRMRIQFLSLIIGPLALILFVSSLLVNTKMLPVPKTMGSLWFGTHILCLFLSIALVTIGFGVGIFYLYIHRQIKNKSASKWLKGNGYSLETLDRINHWVVALGFPLFTIGIVSGFIWARLSWHRVFSWDIKEVWSVIIWIIFAYLFHQRMAIGWKGKKPVVLICWIFMLSLISFLIINNFFPTHHSFR